MTVRLTDETILGFFQDTKNLFERTAQEIREMSVETDRKFREMSAETDRQFRETQKSLEESFKKVNKTIGDLGNRLGEFVEHMVKPASVRIFQERGLDVHQVFLGASAKRDGDRIEVDLVVVNEGSLVAIECKSKATIQDVKDQIKRLGKFKRMFPQWSGHKLHGAIAALVMPESVAKFAEAVGLFVIEPSGDTVELRNSAHFSPKAF
jgi:hypothetical protein